MFKTTKLWLNARREYVQTLYLGLGLTQAKRCQKKIAYFVKKKRWVKMRASGEGQGGLFLGRFYSSKWLAFPVLGHKKGPSIVKSDRQGKSAEFNQNSI